MNFYSQELYSTYQYTAADQLQVFEDDLLWRTLYGESLGQTTSGFTVNDIIPFGGPLGLEAGPRCIKNDAIPFGNVVSYASTRDVPSSVLSSFPGYYMPDPRFQLREYLPSAIDKPPPITEPPDDPTTRETSTNQNIRLAGQAARPSSTTGSAQSVEAKSAKSIQPYQPRTTTRRQKKATHAAVARFRWRPPLSHADLKPATTQVPPSFPHANTSRALNDNAGEQYSAPSTTSPATTSPHHDAVKGFISESPHIPSQGHKRPREVEPTEEREVKRSKKNKERRQKGGKNGFQPHPMIIGWSFEDGKGKRDIFRNSYAPPEITNALTDQQFTF